MECNCQIVNNTGKVITRAALGHSASNMGPDSLQEVLVATNLQPGAVSQNKFAQQETWEADWYTMLIQFEGDANQYILANDLFPFKECETPANGAASLHVLGAGSGGTVRIDTFENSNYTDSDGSASGTLLTPAQILDRANQYKEIVEIIIEVLAE
ncbi:hypothetical protein [uncultured Roseivirga sp.]|uniref:hypothetical protein n=1 Tax=uncultured Roseivirga sp. TaxID=543088 RepID=UPI0030DD1602|tara:strand:+ start:2155 stop:2622 length:468 start_codon:yes stop_codon:yes gene_type:complete